MIAAAQLLNFILSTIGNRSYFNKYVVFKSGIKYAVLCALCRQMFVKNLNIFFGMYSDTYIA